MKYPPPAALATALQIPLSQTKARFLQGVTRHRSHCIAEIVAYASPHADIVLPYYFAMNSLLGSELTADGCVAILKLRHHRGYEALERAAGIILFQPAPGKRQDQIVASARLKKTANLISNVTRGARQCDVRLAREGKIGGESVSRHGAEI